MKVGHPDVAVVIPTYNHAALLQEALESVCAQTVTDWEAVVVNNDSADDTVEVVRSFGDPRIRLTNFRNHGVIGASRNEGVRLTTGRLIGFLDSDDTWDPQKLERVIERFRHDPDLELVCHDEWVIGPDRGRGGRILRHGPSTRYEDLLFKGCCLSPSATAIRRSTFLAVGGFSEDPRFVSAEDYDLWLRLGQRGCRMEYLHEVLGSYRVHDQAFTNSIQRHCEQSFNVLEAHFAAWQPKTASIRSRMRKRRADMLRIAGRSFMQRGDFRSARRLFRTALGHDPVSWKTWVLGGLSLAGMRT